MNKYTIRTETETIYTDKVEVLEKNNFNISYVFVRENHILYRILNGDETELQPDALLLCNEDGTEKQMCQYAHFNTAQEAFDCVNYNTKQATEILKALQSIERPDDENDMDTEDVRPRVYTANFLFNYFGGDYVGDKKIVGAGVDVAFRPYKKGQLVKFCSEKETYFTVEKESRIIGIRKEKIYLQDAVSVSFDREKLVKLTIHKDVVRTICEHFGWDKLDISISEYELDYEEREYGTIEGIMISFCNYEITLLTSGNKVWKRKNAGCHSVNTKYVRMYRIKSVELVEKKKPDFDLDVVDEYKYYHDRNTPKIDWNEKTEIRRKRRELDKANFKEVYKDVPFETSHVFGIICGCRLYYPFQNEGVSAEIYIVQNNGNHAEKVPCKVGTPYPNKNSYHAYNYNEKGSDCWLYTYLPDEKKEYEHVSIVCVWTVKLLINEKKTDIKFVHIYQIGNINSAQDEYNFHFIDISYAPIFGYGNELLTNENSSLMESIMDNDSLFILYQNEDVIRPIKESEDDEVYAFIAQQALAHFSAKELMEMLSSDNSSLPVEVAVEKEDVLQGYYSSSWKKVKPRFEFTLLEK